jgi:non-specific serine/threonine protein kinase
MLETIREFGLEQLRASGEEDAVRQRHAGFYLALAEEADLWAEDGEPEWLDRLEHERDNLRAALAWYSERGDTERCLQLVGNLRGLWYARGSLSDGWTQIESALALPGAEAPTAARAHALRAAGFLAIWRGDAAGSIPLSSEALAICRMLGERAPQPFVLLMLGIATKNLGDQDRAAQYWEQGLALARELGDDVNAARLLANLSHAADDPQDVDRRQALAEEALALARHAGYPATVILCLDSLIAIAFDRGDFRQAARLLLDSLAISAASGWQSQFAGHLFEIARLAAVAGRHVSAARVLGAHDALRAHADMYGTPLERADHDQFVTTLQAAMTEDMYSTAWSAGYAMALDEGIGEARDVLAQVLTPTPEIGARPIPAPHGLSPRELEVLGLMVEGKSDREIADDLFISHHTVSRHVSNILGKLGVPSRAAAAAVAVRDGLH